MRRKRCNACRRAWIHGKRGKPPVGDVLDGKGVTGVFDDAVAGAADRTETVRVKTGNEDLHGMGMVHDAAYGDILWKRNEFVSDFSDHNC